MREFISLPKLVRMHTNFTIVARPNEVTKLVQSNKSKHFYKAIKNSITNY